MSTAATSSTGIPGVYERNRDASEFPFVDDKPSEFVKGPFAESFTLLFSNRCPEALEVFKNYASAGVFGSLNDFLGNGVVGVSLKSSFFAGEFFEMSFGGRGSFLLKRLFECVDSDTHIINGFPGERCPVRGGGEIDDAKIYTETPLGRKRRSIRDLHTKAEIKCALDVEQIGLSPDHALVKLGIRAEDNGHLEPAVNADNGDGIKPLEGKDALVIHNGRVLLENMETLSFGLVGLGDLTDSPDGELSGKAIGFTDVIVTKMVETNLSEPLFLEGNTGDVVTGFVENLDGLHERSLLFLGRKEFDFNDELHGYMVVNLH